MFKFQEKILLKRIRNGDRFAFTRLYHAYVEKVFRFTYFRVKNKEIAEDLTSLTFFKILDYLKDDSQEIKDFRAFLYKTVRNLIADFYRKSLTKKEIVFAKEIDLDKVDKEAPQDIFLNSEIKEVEKALGKLPHLYREPIILHFIEGFSSKEIAEILNESKENVRVRIHRGLKLLREILKN